MNEKRTYAGYIALEVPSCPFGPFCLSTRSDRKLLQGRRHLKTFKNNFIYFFILTELTQRNLPVTGFRPQCWLSISGTLQFLPRFYGDLTSDPHGRGLEHLSYFF